MGFLGIVDAYTATVNLVKKILDIETDPQHIKKEKEQDKEEDKKDIASAIVNEDTDKITEFLHNQKANATPESTLTAASSAYITHIEKGK